MNDQINQWQDLRLRHEPLDVHIPGKFAERCRLTLRPDSDQDLYVERCDLTDRPAQHLDRPERHRAKGQVHAWPGTRRPQPPGYTSTGLVVGNGSDRNRRNLRLAPPDTRRRRIDHGSREQAVLLGRRTAPPQPDVALVADRHRMQGGVEVVVSAIAYAAAGMPNTLDRKST